MFVTVKDLVEVEIRIKTSCFILSPVSLKNIPLFRSIFTNVRVFL